MCQGKGYIYCIFIQNIWRNKSQEAVKGTSERKRKEKILQYTKRTQEEKNKGTKSRENKN